MIKRKKLKFCFAAANTLAAVPSKQTLTYPSVAFLPTIFGRFSPPVFH
jgi:hypothetical protein